MFPPQYRLNDTQEQSEEQHTTVIAEQEYSIVNAELGDEVVYSESVVNMENNTILSSEDYNESAVMVNQETIISSSDLTTGNYNNYNLVDIEYIDGTYVGILGDSEGASSYVFNYTDYDEFQADIQRQIDDGLTYGQEFALVDVEYINGAWYGILNDNVDIIDPLNQDFITPSPEAVLPGVIAGEGSGFTSITPLL